MEIIEEDSSIFIKRHVNLPKNMIFYFILINIFINIHELGHGLVALILGGEIYAFRYAHIIINYNSNLCKRMVMIAGPFISIAIALLINHIAYEKQRITLFLATFSIILYEIFLWCISPLLGIGDSYQLFNSFGYFYKDSLLEFKNLIVILTFTIICLLFFSYTTIKLVKKFKLMIKKEK